MVRDSIRGAAIAAAVGALLASGSVQAEEKTDAKKSDVKCAGVNACKGQGACAGKDNSCGGHNGCSGKGWIHTSSEKKCKDKGGTVLASAESAKGKEGDKK